MSLINQINPNEEYIIEHVDAKPFFGSGLCQAYVHNLYPMEYSSIQMFFLHGSMDWITLKKDQETILKKIIELELDNPGHWKQQLKQWLKKKQALEKTYYELIDKDLSELSDTDLLKYLELIFNNQLDTRRISSAVDAFYLCGSEHMIKLIQDEFKENANKIFHDLTLHENESFLSRVNNELNEISKKIGIDKKLSKEIKKEIEDHVKRYSWIRTHSFLGAKEYTFDDAFGSLQQPMPTMDLEKNKEIRKQAIENYNPSKEIITLSDLSVLFTHWQDLRKENSLMSTYLADKYLKELAKKTEISYEDLTYLIFSELKQLLEGKLDPEHIKQRKNGIYYIFIKDKFETYKPEQVKHILDPILHKEVKNVDKLHGMCASKGKAEGKAKIITKLEHINKVNQDDILVAPTTRPEHLPAMRKAAAIVTDEGGITSHAAITSRELGIPCIVGTKIATKVFKDNNKVKVDADKGVIEIH